VRAIKKYNALPANKKKSFKFKYSAYSDHGVKAALTRDFGGKCAYCETRYATSQPLDVEHWRPKGEVADAKGEVEHKPGYYWLAADWENLLPSCIDCNRQRYQVFLDDAADVEPVLLGKESQFPIEGAPSTRWTKHTDDPVEVPLLLNPCIDFPEKHLYFEDNGFVTPLHRGDAKAESSIRVFALNRSGLVLSRREIAVLLGRAFETLRNLIELHAEIDALAGVDAIEKGALLDLVEKIMKSELETIRGFTDRDRPFSAMCTQLVDRFIATIQSDLDALPDVD